MGIVLGFFSLICFCLLSVKFITRICRLKKADRFFMKIHKPISAVLLICVFLHIALVFRVLKSRNGFVTISGIISSLLMILLIFLCHVIKDKRKRIYLHRVLTVITALFIAGHIAVYYIDFYGYQQKINNMVFEDIDVTEAEDGIYEGEYDAGYIYAKVRVEVRDGMIVSVELLEHENERGQIAKNIIDDVVLNQKIDVDAVSGATNSSKVIKKAVENALKNALKFNTDNGN